MRNVLSPINNSPSSTPRPFYWALILTCVTITVAKISYLFKHHAMGLYETICIFIFILIYYLYFFVWPERIPKYWREISLRKDDNLLHTLGITAEHLKILNFILIRVSIKTSIVFAVFVIVIYVIKLINHNATISDELYVAVFFIILIYAFFSCFRRPHDQKQSAL